MREEEVLVAIVAIISAASVLWICVRHVAWVVRSWIDAALKRDMVARGYSAEEIIAVVTSDRRCRSKSALFEMPPAKPIRQPAY